MNTYWNPFFPVRFLGRNQLFVSDVLNQCRVHNVCVFAPVRASCKCEKKKKLLCFLLVYIYVFCSRGEECSALGADNKLSAPPINTDRGGGGCAQWLAGNFNLWMYLTPPGPSSKQPRSPHYAAHPPVSPHPPPPKKKKQQRRRRSKSTESRAVDQLEEEIHSTIDCS